jgi:uncharacterized membrane protein YccF (DUF307 family)
LANDPEFDAATERLRGKLRAMRGISLTIVAIFVVIIGVWIVLGHWRGNISLFLSTIAMAIAISTMLAVSTSGISAELRRRGRDADAHRRRGDG